MVWPWGQTLTFDISPLMTQPVVQLPAAAGGTEVPVGLGTLGLIPVAPLAFAIGLSLGGTTGYAINPACDLGPRLAHALLRVPGKRDSDWASGWVPRSPPPSTPGCAEPLRHRPATPGAGCSRPRSGRPRSNQPPRGHVAT